LNVFHFHRALENVESNQKAEEKKKKKKRSNFVRFSFQNPMTGTRYQKPEGIGEEFWGEKKWSV
jgi:hypothetical protein